MYNKISLLSIYFAFLIVGSIADKKTCAPPCDSPIYCYGDLLHHVQLNSPFTDSKTFVDMKMKYTEEETLNKFNQMMNATSQNPTTKDIEIFLNQTFDPAGSEFEEWDPVDWVENPKFLSLINDPQLQDWAKDLNELWKHLGRKIKNSVAETPKQYSIVYVPNPVIVPGGRFREFYYWDSFWIVRGLLISEMYNTVKGMLDNFISIVNQYGFVPNGGRIYYSMRSQPPLLIPMVQTYLHTTNDTAFITKNIDSLEKEYLFWETHHTVEVDLDGVNYTLAHYGDKSCGPRPESYKEDYHSGSTFLSETERESHYSELKAAAESGWDFSTRWFISNGTNKGNLTNLKTRSIIPVDLNAILYWNAKILSEFFTVLNMKNKATEYEMKAEKWYEAVNKVLWHEDIGSWLDFSLDNERKRNYFYPSNLAPLWTGCYNKSDSANIIGRVMKYIQQSGITSYLGGIPTSIEHSGEQWDFPNAWPPLQYMIIMGLDSTKDIYAQRLAYELAERWVRANLIGYQETHAMFEKYDATVPGAYGGGGEYELQYGFGWTNGVILDLLVKYGDELTADVDYGESPDENSAMASMNQSVIPAVICTLLALLSCLG